MQRDGGGGVLERVLAGIALDGDANDLPRFFFGFGFGIVENVASQIVRIAERLLLDNFQELCTRFAFAQAGQLLQLFASLAGQVGQLTLLVFQRFGSLAQSGFLLLQVFLPFDDALELGVNQDFPFAEAALKLGPFGAAGGKRLFELLA